MSSYASKMIRFFIFFYALFMPSTIINAVAENNPKNDKLYTQLAKNDETSELDIPQVTGSNIHRVSQILSAPPSELVEQAKSYALGKFNSTLSSETQKWLSQFGTARINFGLDRKLTLKNNSLDILLPIYDNKADWLLFSQLGYRNKDSRNTINLGLGGRYFYQNWMYGLNTFYDHDLTGKNQRMGLGGEIWGDFIKLSANAYYHLSDWKKSLNFEDYRERPATGYDINGEFFLPSYPNLGMKLLYEQYLGDNVTLFNRDTKQKNPSLVTLGLTYTPIPLFTMGVDYKQGKNGHTETQFLANLNFKLGAPLSAQLLPENVASMRTLTGSRYDLVERNNNIVLDHKEIEKEEFIEIEPIIGYGHQEVKINAPISPHADIKKISWVVADKAFKDNKGNLAFDSGKSNVITLPSYQESHKDDYILDILLTNNQGREKAIQVPIKVLPFLIDGEVNIIPPKSAESTGKEENGYTFNSPIITYEGAPSGKFVKNAIINKVIWTTDPALGDESGLEFKLWNNKAARTNEKGELTDEKEQLIPNILTSTKPHENVIVFIQLDGAPKQKIGSVTFSKHEHQPKINFDIASVEVTNFDKSNPFIADGQSEYIYKALIKEGHNITHQTLKSVQWTHDHGGIDKTKFPQPEPYSPTGGDKFTPDENGYIYAKLKSFVSVENVKVTLTIPGSNSDDTKDFVSKDADKNVDFRPVPQPKINFDISSVEVTNSDKGNPLLGNGQSEYHYKALIVEKDKKEKRITYQTLKNVQWTHDHGGIDKTKFPQPEPYSPTGGDKFKPDENGYIYAKLKSSVGVENVKVTLTIPGSNSDDTKDFVSKNADKNVDFRPVPQPAVLYVYNTYTGENKYFDNKGGKRHPRTIFKTLRGELRASISSGAFNQDEVTYGITDVNAPIYGDGMLSFGAGNRGPIQFQATGSATITATINKPSGEIQFYEYKIFATKLINTGNARYANVTDDNTCPVTPGTPPSIKISMFSDKEVADPTDIYNLHNEFGNLYNWGVFSGYSGMDKNKVTIIVKNTSPAIRGKFRVYDSKNNTFDDYSEGVILCYNTTIK
ncbi:inverse autotransporter beta domain-containing protein [Xenorhabdus miraniensis]|uniref:Putative invasin n=1 Tax=Xenorhabdus miraniensis TaxID=351674 RepID=A0A2D0JMC8_9GAMM|nr:inverse autotransporter beta domain-containing protein [Xenorhabdus miraniensis]PHM47458.1 putative invasin [Xenorhabdus miraniensis]